MIDARYLAAAKGAVCRHLIPGSCGWPEGDGEREGKSPERKQIESERGMKWMCEK